MQMPQWKNSRVRVKTTESAAEIGGQEEEIGRKEGNERSTSTPRRHTSATNVEVEEAIFSS
jgi:hypothetical protein